MGEEEEAILLELEAALDTSSSTVMLRKYSSVCVCVCVCVVYRVCVCVCGVCVCV